MLQRRDSVLLKERCESRMTRPHHFDSPHTRRTLRKEEGRVLLRPGETEIGQREGLEARMMLESRSEIGRKEGRSVVLTYA